MNKRTVLILVSLLFLVAVIGVIIWWNFGRKIKGSPNDYIITETNEGIFIENKKAGIVMKAPNGWKAQKIELLEGSISFNSPDIEGVLRNGMINPPLIKGCAIGAGVIYKKMSFDEIKKEIKEIHYGLGIKSEEFEETKFKNFLTLKNTFDSISIGPSISIYALGQNIIYNFGVYWAPNEKDGCVQEFDKFLDGVTNIE